MSRSPTLGCLLEPVPPPSPPRQRRRLPAWVRIGLTLALVGAIFFGVLPQLADLGTALDALGTLAPAESAVLAGAAAGVLVVTWLALGWLIRGATVGQAALAHLTSTAVANTVPGGGAVAVAVNLRVHASYGRSLVDTTTGLVSMALLDNGVKLGLPILLLGLSPLLPGAADIPTAGAALALAVVLATAALAVVLLRSERLLGRVAARAQRTATRVRPGLAGDDWPARARQAQRDLRATLRRHGLAAFAAVTASHALQVLLLVVVLRSLAVPADELDLVRIVVVYALVRFVTAIPVTPGGLGVAELGLVAGLSYEVAAVHDEAILAAVLVFRAATYLLPVLLGGPAWLWWRRHRPAA